MGGKNGEQQQVNDVHVERRKQKNGALYTITKTIPLSYADHIWHISDSVFPISYI